MYLGEENKKNRRLIIGGITFLLVVSYIVAFWNDIREFIHVLILILLNILRGNLHIFDGIPSTAYPSVWMILLNGFGVFFFVFFVWMILLAFQAILPVDGFIDAYRTAWHFLLYMLKLHGFAVFVKNGEVHNTKEDDRFGPGVAVVDFNSAIVLEEKIPAPGLTGLLFQIGHWLLVRLGLADDTASPRAAGPGIVFTRRGEIIRGPVDLRKQFRTRKDVPAYTRDGIEVKARVWAIFTVGQDPDELQVTYEGEPHPDNLRVVSTEKVSDELVRIKGFSDELDRLDRDEIHHIIHVAQTSGQLVPYTPLEERDAIPKYDPHRVFKAVFSEARGDKEELLPWTDLPVQTATAIFREIMAKVNYDELYLVDQDVPLPIPGFKKRMNYEMRNSGLLSFRLLFLRNRQQIQPRKVYNHSELVVSEVRPLTHPKILRDHGIKVIQAGFGDIFPVNEAIYQYRLNVWKASWQRETNYINAAHDLESARIRNRARANAQQDLLISLNSILRDTTITQEVMAVRILQSLESIASNMKTKDMLPGGTLDIMKTARDWLMSGDIPPALSPPAIMPIDGEEL
jgi:hypothetical protein